jgi:hypothetical protein
LTSFAGKRDERLILSAILIIINKVEMTSIFMRDADGMMLMNSFFYLVEASIHFFCVILQRCLAAVQVRHCFVGGELEHEP